MMRMRGFTLIEVLVALAVVAIGLLALVSTAAHYTRQAVALDERMHAGWIAADRLAEYRLYQGFPDPGADTGETTAGGRRWAWRAMISEAPGESDLRRIDVVVSRAETPDETVVLMTGFVGRHRVTGVVIPE